MSEASTEQLDHEQGRWAVEFAREVVESAARRAVIPTAPADIDPEFRSTRGAFVTLEKRGSLRGCIGRPYPEQTAIQAIREAAVGAATNDPRFPPVSPDELAAITVEVSVLTPPTPMEEVSPSAVTVGSDGLIVRAGERSGLLLPQVPVDNDWGPREFLEKTCEKAGLHGECWKRSNVDVLQFGAQVFGEVEPRGSIEAKPLEETE
ncbi:MAG: AmmeMemoRadiSam system protein A [Halodesulfurarchaeum sp.]